MLTVKLVEKGGHEQIREAKQVWTVPGTGAVMIDEPDGGTVTFGGAGTPSPSGMTLYVMNDAGQTVARYTL